MSVIIVTRCRQRVNTLQLMTLRGKYVKGKEENKETGKNYEEYER